MIIGIVGYGVLRAAVATAGIALLTGSQHLAVVACVIAACALLILRCYS